jgi:hypothetical protein
MHGVIDGIYYGQNDRIDELNHRIVERQFSDSPLQPNYDPRPVPTKYALYPMINRRTSIKEPALPYPVYNSSVLFHPGSRAPPSGFSVDTETTLRNQHFALQHGANQGVYVPSSESDLYKIKIVSRPSVQPNPYLFEKPVLDTQPHPNVANSLIGRDTFFNNTRTQLRNSA